MNTGAIFHRCGFPDCYPRNPDELIIQLRTGKDVEEVILIHDDPYAGGCTGHMPWNGQEDPMIRKWEFADHDLWFLRLQPAHKRQQYYFRIRSGSEILYLFEDGLRTPDSAEKPGRLKQYFKFPWMNPVDVIAPPEWVNDTVWYQIMPDRFCKGGTHPRRTPLRNWDKAKSIHFWDTFGGDLKGITQRLPYLRDLGITGIYLTPIFLSNSNHKYNTFSYDEIDPDFGTEEELVALVQEAHRLGIRVMLDAVFNHVGTQFAPWKDAIKRGPESPYFNWFFINQWPQPLLPGKTEDGRFYSFAFAPMMPKLNTNNPEVIDYFLRRTIHWVRDWHIDGIRFDVGNEVSHRFLKDLRRGLKEIRPDVYLLGEIWHDSAPWLQGDEYDAVMNYPLMESLHDFYLDGGDSRSLMYAMNRIDTLYPEQIRNAQLNFLDTHDTMRVLTRCGNEDIFFQQLAFLLAMPGSACLYYGTEIAMPGGNDPDNRRPMPWTDVDAGVFRPTWEAVSSLIALRKAWPQLRRGELLWKHDPAHPRYVRIGRQEDGNSVLLALCLNCGDTPVSLPEGTLLFRRCVEGDTLLPGGTAIVQTEVSAWNSSL